MLVYRKQLEQARWETGEEGVVSHSALVHNFRTPAWKDLGNKDSTLCKFLAKHVPAEDRSSGKYSFVGLLLLGILHCRDNKKNGREKAIALYDCLQEGGPEVHPQIAASDKDWVTVTDQLFTLASISVLKVTGKDTLYTIEETYELEESF